MDARRAQDLLKHITQDEDYGLKAMQKASLAECISMVNNVLPECQKKAYEDGNDNDAGFFSKMTENYRALIIDKIKEENLLWIAYTDLTGYPYMIDGDMIVIYDFAAAKQIEADLNKAGYRVTFGNVDKDAFKTEIAHMYRNGYKKIRFMDGKMEPFVVEREELYPYEEFFKDDYITNPGLQAAMLNYFQEFRKNTDKESIAQILDKRENNMLRVMVNSEYMVPCVKEETDAEVSIAHHFIDVTEQVTHKDGEQVIAIPAFTDGFEMDKCYKGQYENMLYSYKELVEAIEELGASGAIFNPLGISYFIPLETLKKIEKDFC